MTNTAVEAAGDDQPNVDVELGVVIQSLMFRQRVTQRQLAEACGLSAPVISQKLRGRVGISIRDLYAIAGALGVGPGDLLPRLDSNQQPSGYTSPQVSAAVAIYGRPAALHLAERYATAEAWLDGVDARWYAEHEAARFGVAGAAR